MPGEDRLTQSATVNRVVSRSVFPLAVALAVWILVYHDSILSILSVWWVANPYSHGPLSLCLACYMGWSQRRRIAIQDHIDWFAIALVILASVGLWMGSTANVIKIEQLNVYLLLVLTFVALCGWRVLRPLIYPFVILFLTIPVWDFILKPLQMLSTSVAFHAVRTLGIPTIREGFRITMPGGQFVVEPACSGLGFFLTAITLSVFYMYLGKINWRRGSLLILIGASIAIVSNWVRIISILLIGDATKMQSPLVSHHLTFGWILFAAALIPFFYICHRWFPGNFERVDNQGETTAALPSATSPLSAALIATVVALAAVPVLTLAIDAAHTNRAVANISLPSALVGDVVQSSVGAEVPWEVSFPGASDISKAEYLVHNTRLSLLTVSFDRQSQGRELINVNNRLYSSRWNAISDREVTLKELGSIRVKRLAWGTDDRSIAYWYVIAGHATSSPTIAKILEVYGAVTGNRRATLVAVDVHGAPNDIARLVLPFYQWSLTMGQ